MSGSVNLAYDYPLLGAFWTILWISLWVLWFILLFRVIADVFRDDNLGGWGKAGWIVLVIVLPFIGVLAYLLARGDGMGRREYQHAQAQQEAVNSYIRKTAGAPGMSEAEQLAKLSEIRSRGDISDEEFARAKAKILH
ncbi:SHOCT domain-containing protein [Streptomyces palmae]|uniref:SHOCT domain-containing protein n=1 Tax=Streptomyces palmae TaxID=1701085 RepID=A0A4Z0HE54_9ACTN|nr:SHOCT domain-containing protein [Streptomyces palmae]TGB19577.1 SHOCT domain-containing protein [Streptomyces palmae]